MSTDPFEKVFENPDSQILRINDDIDVADISSDEDVETGQEPDRVVSEIKQDVNETQNANSSGEFANIEAKAENVESSVKEASSSSADSSSDQSSDESNDSSSDDDYSESSGEEVTVMDDGVDDEDSAAQDPITSKNEVTEEPLYELPENFELGPNTVINEIGTIKSAFDHNIIVESSSSAEQRVLKENSLLCLQDRRILGPLCEVFGPLQAPFYRVAFPRSKPELYKEFSQMTGQKVFYVAPEAHWHDTFELKRMRGTDASNGFDEELPEEEQEFSDDEKEAMHKKLKKQSKKRKGESTPSSEGAPLVKTAIKRKNNGATPEQSTGMTTSSYRPRSSRHSEANAPEDRLAQKRPSHHQQTHQHQQHRHHHQQPQQHQQQPQHLGSNIVPHPSAPPSYVQQQTYNYPPQGYQEAVGSQYSNSGYASQYNQHPAQPFNSPHPQAFASSNYSEQYYTQPLGSFTHPQPTLNPAYGQSNVPLNPQFMQFQMVPQQAFPQPQLMPPSGFSQPQTQNMQQIWQLQQILMDQQQQHQNNQHQNN
ncbi:LAME_0H05600g1_1 [Lachancea meyersii CBS 8951]|uniref:H/ACA ribonucleoprotein complex non-core subunit NAF1 n=1 Tax=Lachancea meyersii CBS 8951 TaxID=1266667 RepID=A0A1G4KEF0_9SACH|nr:LAME_0H05600g1_1 [Lachancea meyersii CBS 8951]